MCEYLIARLLRTIILNIKASATAADILKTGVNISIFLKKKDCLVDSLILCILKVTKNSATAGIIKIIASGLPDSCATPSKCLPNAVSKPVNEIWSPASHETIKNGRKKLITIRASIALTAFKLILKILTSLPFFN